MRGSGREGTGQALRLLVRLPNWLGDALLARPLLHALRAAFPQAHITAVGPGQLLTLIDGARVCDALEAWPREREARARLTEKLQANSPDAALVLPPSFSSALFAWKSGARFRVGYAHEARSLLLTHPLRRGPRGAMHLSEEYRALGDVMGHALGRGTQADVAAAAPPVAVPPLRPAADALADARALRERAGRGGEAYAVLGPGAIYGPAKRWPPERFAELGRRLAARGLTVFLCGTDPERAICGEVAAAIGGPAIDVAGRTTLPVLAALAAEAAVVVCNDSGLAHLAGAVGAPTVAIFGSTSSAWTAPLGSRVTVVQRAPVCAPCFQKTCRIGYRCLEAVSVARVLDACEVVAA